MIDLLTDTKKITDWLPITQKELEAHGWEEPDVILISGDAYVDHPAFGTAVIGESWRVKALKLL